MTLSNRKVLNEPGSLKKTFLRSNHLPRVKKLERKAIIKWPKLENQYIIKKLSKTKLKYDKNKKRKNRKQ